MQIKENEYDVGVIIGRFQIHELHEAHKQLIETVQSRHKRTVILLGCGPVLSTRNNPLSFEPRQQMINESYPDILCMPLQDRALDEVWSKDVDSIINTYIPLSSVVIYGGRDSFIKHYSGKYPVLELQADNYVESFSATNVRYDLSHSPTISSADFRAGAIWAAHNKYPTVYPTVDVAIFNRPPLTIEAANEHEESSLQILLGRKPNETRFRLIGGFADARCGSYEIDARREVYEETKLEVSSPKYIGSFKVDDWRYRNEVDCIKTMLFICHNIYGSPQASDDIEEVEWFRLHDFKLNHDLDMPKIVPNHIEMILKLQEMFK